MASRGIANDSGGRPKQDLQPPRGGIALCLSGGGYRAMLFHLGALWRLNELGYLTKLDAVSGVSGGSIVAGVLALKWDRLGFDDGGVARRFEPEIIAPIRHLADKMIEVQVVLTGGLGRGSIKDKAISAYREHLFGEATLQDLPDRPQFVINATNVQSGALWRFTKLQMGDERVGKIDNPTTKLAVAIAASAAFPPFLSPVTLKLDASAFTPGSGADLAHEPFTTDVVLTDGGVYDNLGLEAARQEYDTLLVSDAGGEMEPEPEPKMDWPRHTYRVLTIINEQVRTFPKRHLVESFKLREHMLRDGASEDDDLLKLATRKGTYWGIRSDIANYGLPSALDCPVARTTQLARIRTALERLDATLQERLIDWGYAVCDAAMRRHVDTNLPEPDGFPYQIGVG